MSMICGPDGILAKPTNHNGKIANVSAGLAKFSKESSIVTKLEEEKKADSKCIVDLESALSNQVELHKSEVSRLEEKLDEFSENLEVKKEKCEIAKTERNRVQKNVEELRLSKEQSFSVATQCCDKLKYMFANVGAFSVDQNFICKQC
jgi:exonuclease VII large subunit